MGDMCDPGKEGRREGNPRGCVSLNLYGRRRGGRVMEGFVPCGPASLTDITAHSIEV